VSLEAAEAAEAAEAREEVRVSAEESDGVESFLCAPGSLHFLLLDACLILLVMSHTPQHALKGKMVTRIWMKRE
jgi:hypothetical protein